MTCKTCDNWSFRSWVKAEVMENSVIVERPIQIGHCFIHGSSTAQDYTCSHYTCPQRRETCQKNPQNPSK